MALAGVAGDPPVPPEGRDPSVDRRVHARHRVRLYGGGDRSPKALEEQHEIVHRHGLLAEPRDDHLGPPRDAGRMVRGNRIGEAIDHRVHVEPEVLEPGTDVPVSERRVLVGGVADGALADPASIPAERLGGHGIAGSGVDRWQAEGGVAHEPEV